MKDLLLSFLLFCSIPAFSQKTNRFENALRQFNLEYKAPKGYLRLDSAIKIVDGKSGHVIAASFFQLKSEDGNLLIAVSFQGPIDTNQRNTFKNPDGKVYDPNKNYIPFNIAYKSFSTVLSKQRYNANASGTWDMMPSKYVHVLDKDEMCKVIVFHKENLVDVEMYYFYKDISLAELNKRIRDTKRILRFKAYE